MFQRTHLISIIQIINWVEYEDGVWILGTKMKPLFGDELVPTNFSGS